MTQTPDFDSIKQTNPYGMEYWSARDLMPLLGYKKWQKFEDAIARAMTACTQSGNIVDQHFTDAGKTSQMPHGGVSTKADARATTAGEQSGNIVGDHFTGPGKVIKAGKGATETCEQSGNIVGNHFTDAGKMVKLGSDASAESKTTRFHTLPAISSLRMVTLANQRLQRSYPASSQWLHKIRYDMESYSIAGNLR